MSNLYMGSSYTFFIEDFRIPKDMHWQLQMKMVLQGFEFFNICIQLHQQGYIKVQSRNKQVSIYSNFLFGLAQSEVSNLRFSKLEINIE